MQKYKELIYVSNQKLLIKIIFTRKYLNNNHRLKHIMKPLKYYIISFELKKPSFSFYNKPATKASSVQ